MNLLLLEAGEIDATGEARIRDPARLQALAHLNLKSGARLRAGVINGRIGSATVIDRHEREIKLRVNLDRDPPARSPVDLVLALPRPKMLRRILRTASEAGIAKIWLMNSFRVEKSYWQSPLLSLERWWPYLLEGLQQAGDSMLPQVILERRFRPFVEDRLERASAGRMRLLAHPGSDHPSPSGAPGLVTLVVGPEGGFTEFEVTLLEQVGFSSVSLGERVYRVETALPMLLGRLLQ